MTKKRLTQLMFRRYRWTCIKSTCIYQHEYNLDKSYIQFWYIPLDKGHMPRKDVEILWNFECNFLYGNIDYIQYWIFFGYAKLTIIYHISKQNRSTEGWSKLKRSVDMTSSRKNGLNIRTNASPKWDRTGVRRSKRPLLASRTRCNVLWKPPKFGNKVKIGIKVQFGNKFANRCNVWSIEGVIVYGHVPECHVTFGRGKLHNVWWDPHIDHKTSWGTISNVPWHIPVRGA